jgi:hypothetical protein
VSIRILVSDDCQTGSLASALVRLTTVKEIHAVPAIGGQTPDERRAKLRAYLNCTDLWIVVSHDIIAHELLRDEGNGRIRLLKIPHIRFDAFHPDICSVKHRETKLWTDYNYNSLIAAWSYSQGFGISATVALFNKKTFRQLGYFNAWDNSVGVLRNYFDQSDLKDSFNDFFLSIKRSGCFMHSYNHPKIGVMIELANIVAKKAGLNIVRSIIPGELNDALNDNVWPVYPDIADDLGLGFGSYRWKLGSQYIDSLESYVASVFRYYENFKFKPNDIEFSVEVPERFDQVLCKLALEY